MGYADMIARELATLRPDQQAEVLEFVAGMKRQGALLPELTDDQRRRRDDLLTLLGKHRIGMAGFAFDRDDANARR